MTVQTMFKSDKWAVALERLNHEDRERFDFAKTGQHGAHDVLVDVLEATTRKKNECMEKRWKVAIKGRVIILRDVVEKISVWVSKVLVRMIIIMSLLPPSLVNVAYADMSSTLSRSLATLPSSTTLHKQRYLGPP